MSKFGNGEFNIEKINLGELSINSDAEEIIANKVADGAGKSSVNAAAGAGADSTAALFDTIFPIVGTLIGVAIAAIILFFILRWKRAEQKRLEEQNTRATGRQVSIVSDVNQTQMQNQDIPAPGGQVPEEPLQCAGFSIGTVRYTEVVEGKQVEMFNQERRKIKFYVGNEPNKQDVTRVRGCDQKSVRARVAYSTSDKELRKPGSFVRNTKLYTNLPAQFYNVFMKKLKIADKKVFPTMCQGKAKLGPIGNCLVKLTTKSKQSYTQIKYEQDLLTSPFNYEALKNTDFAISKWQELGWQSQEEYKKWLSTPTTFALTGSGHYCETPRLFNYAGKKTYTYQGDEQYTPAVFNPKTKQWMGDMNVKGKQEQHDVFVETQNDDLKTYIFTVVGYELRNGSGALDKIGNTASNAITPQFLKKNSNELQDFITHSKLMMSQILAAAKENKITDVVMIPVGMGVFLAGFGSDIKPKILDGWTQALNDYQGPGVMRIQCCLLDGQFETLSSLVHNPHIELVNRQGCDSYTVANGINDMATRNQTGRKAMLINAGDHDWLIPFSKEHIPGQCYAGHTFTNYTSDEYYGLSTKFGACSVQNLFRINNLDEKKEEDGIINFIHSTAHCDQLSAKKGSSM